MKILFFDLETTGLKSAVDAIVEISMILYHDKVKVKELTTLVNPGRPIPPEVTEIHGITDEMVAGAPKLSEIISEIVGLLDEANVIGGYNSNRFDVPFLCHELAKNGVTWDWKKKKYVDACDIFKSKEERTLTAAVRFYLGKEHEGAHKAADDVMATADVFFAQLEKYGMSLEDAFEMSSISRRVDVDGKFALNDDGKVIINFGAKCMGALASNEKSYVSWMLKTPDFHPDTHRVCKLILGGYLS